MTTQKALELDPYAVELGANIHAVMWRKKITQAQLGAALGLTQVSVSRKLRGLVPTTVPELMTIAGALGVDAGDLLPKLPRLDSNQEPSGYVSAQVIAFPAHRIRCPRPAGTPPAPVRETPTPPRALAAGN